MVVEGKMQYLFDETGRRYLDVSAPSCRRSPRLPSHNGRRSAAPRTPPRPTPRTPAAQGFGGIVTVSVGHCHPAVTAATAAQSQLLQHATTIYLHPGVALFAEELAARMPGDLKARPPCANPPPHWASGTAGPPQTPRTPRRTAGCVLREQRVRGERPRRAHGQGLHGAAAPRRRPSGCECVSLGPTDPPAARHAIRSQGNFDVIALRGGYHGMSLGTMGMTGHATWKYNQAQACLFLFTEGPDAALLDALACGGSLVWKCSEGWCRPTHTPRASGCTTHSTRTPTAGASGAGPRDPALPAWQAQAPSAPPQGRPCPPLRIRATASLSQPSSQPIFLPQPPDNLLIHNFLTTFSPPLGTAGTTARRTPRTSPTWWPPPRPGASRRSRRRASRGSTGRCRSPRAT